VNSSIENKIKEAYKESKNIYDNILTAKGFWSKVYNKLAWGMNDKDYVPILLSFIPDDFNGKMLDIPVGTAVFTADKYARLKGADITVLDYSIDMLSQAEKRFADMKIRNVTCLQGDVAKLPFETGSLDLVFSMNGFHAFPDKEKAFKETARVLKKDGLFCGCFYISGERKVTDFTVNKILTPRGWFTPPFYNRNELRQKLDKLYTTVEIYNVKSIVYFKCMK
jgi:ubiquinone/menaquinone biosynthesis C-methylase UbiE